MRTAEAFPALVCALYICAAAVYAVREKNYPLATLYASYAVATGALVWVAVAGRTP